MHEMAGALLAAFGMASAATGLTGCGGQPTASAPPAVRSPLSVEEWRKISEPHIRHDPETLERLKKGDRDLQTQEGWEDFEREELAKTEP